MIIMGREKSRAKKRRFQGNKFVKIAKKARTTENPQCCPANTDGQPSTSGTNSASRKISLNLSDRAEQDQPEVTGYRFIDLEILSEVFLQTSCKECGNASCLVLEDKSFERKGSASHLRIRCDQCGWVFAFYSSKKVKQSFDVNKRLVYAMRSIGQGHASMKRFCALMNMPSPMQFKAYRACNIALSKATTTVAMKIMNDAADEIRGENQGNITQCGVSCDGTWQRRGYSSLNGCVTTLSIDTGKCLDVEMLTKVCHGCHKIAKMTDVSKKADLLEKHQCQANYKGISTINGDRRCEKNLCKK